MNLKKFDFVKSGEKLTRDKVETLLKKAADLIRTRVDYEYILVFLFLKRLSDKWEAEYQEAYAKAKEKGLTGKEAEEEAQRDKYHNFDFPKECLWKNITKDREKLSSRIYDVLQMLGDNNPEVKDFLQRSDFLQFTKGNENEKILRQLVDLFDKYQFDDVSSDVLGDGYEWLLRYFAPEKAKEGEVYTPREVIDLIVNLLDPEPEESVYDPACGSGAMLVASNNYVKEKSGDSKRIELYGQEANHETLALSRMNMFIHEIDNVELHNGDTLLYPGYTKNEQLQKFDYVIANPPWNQKGYSEDDIKEGDLWRERFTHGFATGNSADWNWVQHMLASAKDDGKVGVVLDTGVLFRSWGKDIRKSIIQEDLIECVILLPEKLFYNTGAPGTIIIFNKDKPSSKKEKIFFINASEEYGDHPEVRKLNILNENNIEKIVSTYRDYNDNKGFSRLVDLSEIEKNDFNLNVSLYVFPEIERENIDINQEWKELKQLENNIKDIERKIEDDLRQIKEVEEGE